jgi:hypothetical protein
MSYDDTYETCAETFATLRVYDVDPERVTSLLGVEPTSVQLAGSPIGRAGRLAPRHGWFLATKGRSPSLDSRRHLDEVLVLLADKGVPLAELRAMGAQIDVTCYWRSAQGHGGPTLSPKQSSMLGRLGLDLWFDLYAE